VNSDEMGLLFVFGGCNKNTTTLRDMYELKLDQVIINVMRCLAKQIRHDRVCGRVYRCLHHVLEHKRVYQSTHTHTRTTHEFATVRLITNQRCLVSWQIIPGAPPKRKRLASGEEEEEENWVRAAIREEKSAKWEERPRSNVRRWSPSTLNPKPSTLNPKSYTLYPMS
jgi:hypothetical protein